MHKAHRTLREQTEQYWHLSTTYNGRGNDAASITTQSALLALKDIIENLGPKRRLRSQAGLLMSDIIAPKRTKKKRKLPPPIKLPTQRSITQ